MPDIPTLVEQGFDVDARLWLGMVAPKGTPAPAVAKLREAVKKIAEDTSFKTMMTRMGQEAEYLSADDMQKQWNTDQTKIKAVISSIAPATPAK